MVIKILELAGSPARVLFLGAPKWIVSPLALTDQAYRGGTQRTEQTSKTHRLRSAPGRRQHFNRCWSALVMAYVK